MSQRHAKLPPPSEIMRSLLTFRYRSDPAKAVPLRALRSLDAGSYRFEQPDLEGLKRTTLALVDCDAASDKTLAGLPTEVRQLVVALQLCLQFSLHSQRVLKARLRTAEDLLVGECDECTSRSKLSEKHARDTEELARKLSEMQLRLEAETRRAAETESQLKSAQAAAAAKEEEFVAAKRAAESRSSPEGVSSWMTGKPHRHRRSHRPGCRHHVDAGVTRSVDPNLAAILATMVAANGRPAISGSNVEQSAAPKTSTKNPAQDDGAVLVSKMDGIATAQNEYSREVERLSKGLDAIDARVRSLQVEVQNAATAHKQEDIPADFHQRAEVASNKIDALTDRLRLAEVAVQSVRREIISTTEANVERRVAPLEERIANFTSQPQLQLKTQPRDEPPVRSAAEPKIEHQSKTAGQVQQSDHANPVAGSRRASETSLPTVAPNRNREEPSAPKLLNSEAASIQSGNPSVEVASVTGGNDIPGAAPGDVVDSPAVAVAPSEPSISPEPEKEGIVESPKSDWLEREHEHDTAPLCEKGQRATGVSSKHSTSDDSTSTTDMDEDLCPHCHRFIPGDVQVHAAQCHLRPQPDTSEVVSPEPQPTSVPKQEVQPPPPTPAETRPEPLSASLRAGTSLIELDSTRTPRSPGPELKALREELERLERGEA